MTETTPSLVRRITDAETDRIVEIVAAHADMDERGNRVLVDLIIDEIGGGSEVRTVKAEDANRDRGSAVRNVLVTMGMV